MRLLSITLLTALAVPVAALAQSVKQVEVINLPAVQDVTGSVEVINDASNPVEVIGEVEVTNLPTASAPARFQLVGFTAGTLLGNSGVLGFTAACQSEFSTADVRMCTSVEVMNTTAIPSELSGQAWVRPVVVAGGNASALVDASLEVGASNTLSCSGWTGTGGAGLTVLAKGAFFSDVCAIARPVSCCAPVP